MLRPGGKGGIRCAGRYFVLGEPADELDGRGGNRVLRRDYPRRGSGGIRRLPEGRGEGGRPGRGAVLGGRLPWSQVGIYMAAQLLGFTAQGLLNESIAAFASRPMTDWWSRTWLRTLPSTYL